MKKVLLALLLFTGSFPGTAQQKNRIELGVGSFHVFNEISHNRSPYDLMNLTYQRRVAAHWALRISLMSTTHYGSRFGPAPFISSRVQETTRFDELVSRGEYYFFDLAASYRFFNKGRHALSAFAGPSMAYGNNKYLREFSVDYDLLITDNGYFGIEWIFESYGGALAGLRYDYALWDNRLNIGSAIVGRYYFNNFPFFMLNYGLRVGYNF